MLFPTPILIPPGRAIQHEFPVLHQEVNGHPLIYLDNAATTQKPQRVIQAITRYYQEYNANIPPERSRPGQKNYPGV